MENNFHIKPLVPKNKKGLGIGDIYPIVLTIALVAILLAIVMFILQEFGDQWTDLESDTILNESLITAHQGTVNLTVAHATDCNANTFAVTEIRNLSGVLITAANYTFYNDGNVINLTEEFPYAWYVDYTYDWGGQACQATEDIADDFTDFIPWIGVILLIVAAAIVLGILMRSFSGGGRI